MRTRNFPYGHRLLAALGLLTAAACGTDSTGPGDPGDPPPPAVASIRVDPTAPTLAVGQSTRLVAMPLSVHGQELADRPVAWQSADTSKAVIGTDGTVTAIAVGTVPLTVSSEAVSRQIVLTVLPLPPAYVWMSSAEASLVEGDAMTMQAEVRDSLDQPMPELTVTWMSLDASIATVDGAGTITARRRGTTYVLAMHGSLEATARVDVTEYLAADLLFDAVEPTETLPRIYRKDPNDPAAATESVFGSAGTWQAAPSPDGSRLAFTCMEMGPAICTSSSDGTDVRMLTGSDTFYEDHPTWSPDGTRIAFRRWSQIGTPGISSVTDIWVMDANGSNPVNVTNDAEMQHAPAWSPVLSDGSTRIAYQQTQLQGGYLTARLFTMRPDGTDNRVETPEDGRIAAEPAWSPDGTEIVYFNNGGEVFGDLWVLSVGLRQERPLMDAPLEGEQHAPAWSPDGRYIAFTSEHELTDGTTYRSQVYTVRADGTDVMRRTDGMQHKYAPTWIVRP